MFHFLFDNVELASIVSFNTSSYSYMLLQHFPFSAAEYLLLEVLLLIKSLYGLCLGYVKDFSQDRTSQMFPSSYRRQEAERITSLPILPNEAIPSELVDQIPCLVIVIAGTLTRSNLPS